MTRLAATVSIDLDDLWAYRRSFGLPGAGPSLLPMALPRFLQFMAGQGLRGTAFIVGQDAPRPELAPLWRRLAAAGHEPGNHSWQHAGDLQAWPAARQQADLRRAHEAIAQATGVAPCGFRGPAFRVSASLLASVQALGYRYDSSTFPNALAALARRWQQRRAAALGQPVRLAAGAHGAMPGSGRLPLAPYTWQLPGGPLVEVPITTLPGLRLPLHGTYLQHLADLSPAAARAYAALALRTCQAAGVAPHLLLHATDFVGSDDGLDTAFLPGMSRPWRDKVALLTAVVQRLRGAFDAQPLAAYVQGLAAGGVVLPQRRPVADAAG